MFCLRDTELLIKMCHVPVSDVPAVKGHCWGNVKVSKSNLKPNT